jgi:TRAP-type mannitol/chloroaromatic compound transport system permease large subunit
MVEYIPLIMFAAVCLVLMLGYPVAFSLAGTALIFAGAGIVGGVFDSAFLSALPSRLFGTINNTSLMAVPLFVMMGVMLEKSRLAEQLLENMAAMFGRQRGGLAISVVIVGMLLAASTGIVGATVVTMGLMSLPTMLNRGYDAIGYRYYLRHRHPRANYPTVDRAGTTGRYPVFGLPTGTAKFGRIQP